MLCKMERVSECKQVEQENPRYKELNSTSDYDQFSELYQCDSKICHIPEGVKV